MAGEEARDRRSSGQPRVWVGHSFLGREEASHDFLCRSFELTGWKLVRLLRVSLHV